MKRANIAMKAVLIHAYKVFTSSQICGMLTPIVNSLNATSNMIEPYTITLITTVIM